MTSHFHLGDILESNGSPCVVVGLSGQLLGGTEIPEEHIAVWFGETAASQEVEDASQKPRMEVRTIPEKYFKEGLAPVVSH